MWVKSIGICFMLSVSVIEALLWSLMDTISNAGTGKLRQESVIGMVNQSDKKVNLSWITLTLIFHALY